MTLRKELCEVCHSNSLSEDGLREILERYGCAPNNNLNIDDYFFFIVACNNELVTEGIIRCLLEYFPNAAGATIAAGLSPLQTILCANKNVTRGMVQLLIDAYPESLRIGHNNGDVPLHTLCLNKNLEDTVAVDILGLLLERCPEAARRASDDGRLPIHIAAGQGARSNTVEFCRMLIEAYPGSERIATSEDALLPVHFACRVGGTVETVQYLLRLYPDGINVADGDGSYPIHHAILRLKSGTPTSVIEMVQFLLDCDPNVASQTFREKFTPLCLLCAMGFNDNASMSVVLKILHLLYDAHPEAIEGDDLVESFDFDSFPEDMQNFINAQRTYARQSRDPTVMSTRDENGQLPLHQALRDNVILGSIKLLVKGNCDSVRVPDHSGWLPLHVAIQYHDSPKVVDYLVGLDPNTLAALDGLEGNTALHLACRAAKHDTIAILLEKYNAVSVSKTNENNKLPIHLLLESYNFDKREDVSREDDIKYTESIFRLLRAYPETAML